MARTHTWTRLTRSAYAGNTTIVLPEREISSWRPGDQIVVAPSEYDPMESELKTIASIDGSKSLTVCAVIKLFSAYLQVC